MSEPVPQKLVSREFLIVAAAAMLFFGSMGASNPILPKFVVDELGGTEATSGLVVGSFAISALTLRAWFGRLGDRRGARWLMIIGGIIGAAGMVLFAFAGSVPLAIAARLLSGAAQAAVMTGSTVLAIDLAPAGRRGEATSYVFVAFHLGLGLGPIIGETALSAGGFTTVWLVLAIGCISSVGIAMLLPYRPGYTDKPPSPLIHKAGIAPGVVSAFGLVGFVGFSFYIPLYARELGIEEVAKFFTIASISIAAVRIVFGKAPDVLGPIRATTIALTIMTAGTLVLALWEAQVGLYVAAALIAAGLSLQTPSLVPVAVEGVPDHERSSAMATFTSFLDLSAAVAGPLLGIIVSNAGYRPAFLATTASTLIAFGVLQLYLKPHWNSRRLDNANT